MAEHQVLNAVSSVDKARIDDLAAVAGTRILDTTATQLDSLRELLPMPQADVLDEDPRWIHYPWRGALVRVLGPLGYRRLRLDRNRNKITADEQARMADLTVGVVGLSVGHAVAHTLAIEGLCGELRLADFDELDLSNLNRVPATVFDLGVNKSVVAARRIAEVDPYLSVLTFPQGLTETTVDSFMDGLDIVVDECDSLDAKLVLREHARRRGIPVVMETSDGGILGDVDASALVGLTNAEKAPLAARILDPRKLTVRMLASLPEIGTTLSTWPQLGSDVALGGASVAAVVRAFGIGSPPRSGRVRVNLDAYVAEIAEVHPPD